MKQTKSKKSMKQFLTLMLAFVMVFTGMGIGSRGVDTAWADETSTNQQISIEDTIEKTSIGSYNGYNVWEVVLAEEINSFTLTSTSGMNATTADDGTGGQRENKAIEKNDSNFAAAKSYFETVKASISGYTFNDNDHLLFRVSQFDITTFTVVVKGYIAVTWNVAETIRTDISIDEMLGKEAVGTYNGGKVYKVLLPKNVEAFTLTSTSGMNATTADDGTGGQRENKAIEKNDSNFAAAKSYFETAKTSIPELTFSSNDYLLFRISQFDITTFTVIIKGYILVEWERGTDSTNIDELRNLINTISAMNEDEYYNKDDRYNGKDNSSTGFWKDMQSALTTAKGLFTDETLTSLKTGVPRSQVNKAKEDLDSAITNLIPKTEVNATALYEAIQRANAKAEADYTETSWKPFDAAKSAADAMLGKLYVNGEATNLNRGPAATGEDPEGAIHQENVDAAAQSLNEAMANLLRRGDESWISETTEFVAKLLPKLITQAETAKKADYTAESWSAFQTALTAAKAAEAPSFTGFASDREAAETYWAAYENLYSAYYYNLVTTAKFTVQFETVDAANARAGSPATGISENISLNAGAKLNDLTAKYSITSSTHFYAAMINGVLVSQNFKTLQTEPTLKTGNPILHPDDEVTFIPTMNPQSGMGATLGTVSAMPWQYLEWVKKAEFQAESVIEAEAGKAFTVTIEQKAASLGDYTGEKTAASSMSLFLSDVKTERGGQVQTSKLLADGKAVTTDENGNAELTIYQEGWYLLQAYDLAEDKIGSMPNYVTDEWSKGEYHSVNSGASVWVHVKASSDADKVKAELKAKLDEVYNAYPQSFFRPENWSLIQTAYETGISGISQAEAIGDARTAQQDAIVAIKQIQQQTEAENERNVNTFRENLNKLPDDVKLITKSVERTVNALLASYEAMSGYQKTLLTKIETEKYENIKKASENGLAEAKNYTLTLKIEGDTDEATTALNAMTDYLKKNLAKQDSKTSLGTGASIQKVFSFLNRNTNTAISEAAPLTEIRLPLGIDYAAYFHVRDAKDHTISGDGWSISDSEDGVSQS